ncbi:MAG TPA: class I SAM-dependent methyltransferase [Moheibacter sp.]|nr:class I SAM-dependent methyltransferase [Moheibacter sp.]
MNMFHVKQTAQRIDLKQTKLKNNFKVVDYFLTNEVFELNKNKNFGYLETHPQPENLGIYYASEAYISHTDARDNFFARCYQILKSQNIRYKFNKLGKHYKGKMILDYGCGTGDFLKYAQSKGANVLGVEPNEAARKIAQQKIGEDFVTRKNLLEITPKFDAVTFWHVLEHIPNLDEILATLPHKLKPDGRILLALPNHQSFDAKYYKKYWAAYDVPRHLWHFCPKSLEKLLYAYGMEIEKKYPMWLDSYYVSLLSEKYRGKKNRWLRAIAIGTISNLKGILDGNYSAIIYKIKIIENKSK